MRTHYRIQAARWYKSRKWKQLRARQLAAEPYCQCSKCDHKGVRARVADHIKPHRGDSRLFWNYDNLQSLCTFCHSSCKAKEEGGRAMSTEPRYTETGEPVAEDHHWNTR